MRLAGRDNVTIRVKCFTSLRRSVINAHRRHGYPWRYTTSPTMNGFAKMARHRKLARLILAMAILSSFIGCDQATKQYATETLQHSEPQSYLGDTVRLDYALNPGGFLSMGSQLPPTARFYIFVGVNLCVMIAVTLFLCFNWNARLAIFVSLAYILAGGIGNLIDRISNDGLVTDFLNVGVGSIRTGIFNVADVGVMFGALVLVFCLYRNHDVQCESQTGNAV